jgi:hypothetical protein
MKERPKTMTVVSTEAAAASPEAAELIENFANLDAVMQTKILRWIEGPGWLKSLKTHRPLDKRGRPIPWYTYAASNLLLKRMITGLKVFEFGSGNSTLWWAKHADQVISVEHNADFFKEIKKQVPANVDYRHAALQIDGDYARMAASTGQKFDVIVNDGKDRSNVAKYIVPSLVERGIIIWDNSHRPADAAGMQLLIDQGFKRADFIGAGPINVSKWETAIFYRPGNWLNL